MQTTKKIDVAAAVKNAVESVPSRALLIAARAKLTELTAGANNELAEIDRLRNLVGGDSVASRAKALLAGKPITDGSIDEVIKAATRRVVVFQEAMLVQSGIVKGCEVKLLIEAKAALHGLRQPLVTRVAAALAELRSAAADDAEINAEMAKAGVVGQNGYDASVTNHPVLRGIVAEFNWLQLMRDQGYTV